MIRFFSSFTTKLRDRRSSRVSGNLFSEKGKRSIASWKRSCRQRHVGFYYCHHRRLQLFARDARATTLIFRVSSSSPSSPLNLSLPLYTFRLDPRLWPCPFELKRRSEPSAQAKTTRRTLSTSLALLSSGSTRAAAFSERYS